MALAYLDPSFDQQKDLASLSRVSVSNPAKVKKFSYDRCETFSL
jgi:hypothetical protein